MLVDNLVSYINQDCEDYFSLSAWICVGTSISHMYSMGGSWINDGLPEYRAIDFKPEKGCEIQNICDGQSGIMLRIKLVKTDEPEFINQDLNHGTKVLVYLVMH